MMPLRAIDGEGQSWQSWKGDHVEHILAQPPGSFLCPHCGARMGFRREGKRGPRKEFKVAAHFFHITKQCASTAAHHKESEEHQTAKMMIVEKLRAAYAGYSDAAWDTEVFISEVNRIADVLFIFPDGRRVIHEAQLSPQTQYDFQQRTDDYHSAGYDVMWWLGPRVQQHDRWCLDELNIVGYVDIDYDDTTTALGDNKAA